MGIFRREDGTIEHIDPLPAMGDVMVATVDVNPDDLAEVHSLAKQLRLSPDVVSMNRPLAKRMAAAPDLGVIDNTAPVLAGMGRDYGFMALASDDLYNLAKIEQKISAAKPKQEWWKDVIQPTPSRALASYQKGTGGMYQWLGEGLGSDWLTNTGKGIKEDAALVEKQIVSEHPVDPNSTKGAVSSALSSMYLQAPFMAVGALANTAKNATALSLSMMGYNTAGQTYADRRDKGFSPMASGFSAAWDGVVEVGTELLPTKTLFEMMKPAARVGFGKLALKIGELYGEEMLGESTATFLQDSNDKVMTSPDMNLQQRVDKLGEYFSSGEAYQNWINTIKSTAVQTTLMAGSGAGMNRVANRVYEGKFKAAQEQQQKLVDVFTSAEASKLNTRSPELFSEFAQRAADQHGVGTVYLQADRVLEEAQKAGIAQEEIPPWLEKYGVTQNDFTAALVSGGNVEMETGKIAAGLKDDPILSSLQNDMMIDPEAHPASRVENGVVAEQEHLARLNDLHQQEQDRLIQPEDMDSWEESVLAQEGLRGRVKKESLLPLVARANVLGKLTGGPAIEHLNRMLEPTGLRAMKLRDFQAAGQAVDVNETPVRETQTALSFTGETQKYQQQQDTPLGALSQEGGQNVISLFEKADKSTFLHETGHIFLNDLKHMAETQGVQTEVWNATKQWLSVGEDGAITKEMHEQFAEHFEAYLMEGKAPTIELRNAFRTFKRWLTHIYEMMKSGRFGQRDHVELSPEVSSIFDRLLATEQEIKQAQEHSALVAMLDDQLLNNTGFSKEQIDEYRRVARQSEDSAREKRDDHKLAGSKERLKGWRAQATGEFKKVPVVAFTDFLSRNAGGEYGKGVGISKQSILDAFGEVKLPSLPGLWRKDGMDVNQAIAEHGDKFGYETAAGFVSALIAMQPRELWLDKRVAQLEAQHIMAQDTNEAIRTAGLRKMLEIESKWLEKQIERAQEKAEKEKISNAFRQAKVAAIPPEIMKAWAEQVVAGRNLAQIQNLGKMLVESRRHRQQAVTLARKGDWTGALKSNEQARLTEELIAASYRAKNQWEKIQSSWKKIAKWTNDNRVVKVGQDFRDQINRILSAYGIAKAGFNPQAKDLHSFVADFSAADEMGLGTTLPGWIGFEIAPADKLSWERIKDLDNAIKFLYGHGREEVEGLKTSNGEYVKDVAFSIVKAQSGLKGDKLKTLKSEATAFSRTARDIQKKHRKFFANTAILRFIAQRMDGYTNVGGNGEMGRAEELVQRVINGMAGANDMFTEISKQVEPSLEQLSQDKGKIFTDLELPELFKRHGMVWTKERVVAACLNMGNESNMQRLMDGYGIDRDGINALQGKLTAADWKALEGLWKAVDSLWPKIAEVHKRLNYFEPKKIAADSFTVFTAEGERLDLSGGYWPASYDKSLDKDIARWNEKDDILASSEAILQVPVAKSGFAKGRMATVSRPLNLSLSVLARHLTDTIRYITQAEAIRDADRVFQNTTLTNRNEETIGAEMHDMIRPALKNVIRPEPNNYGLFESGRVKMSMYYMGYNAWTALQNVTGVFPAIRAAGMGNYLNGISHVLKNPLAAQRAMVETSAYMRLRENNIERDMKKQARNFKVDGFKINGKRYTFEDVQSLGFAGIRFIDAVVALPAWWGKYNGEMDKHGDMQKAIAAADTAINKALGSGLSIDSTGFGRHKFLSLLCPFMSFAATQQEVLSSEQDAWKNGKMSTADYLYGRLMVQVLPSVMSTFLQGALMYGIIGALGGGDDDRKKKDLSDYFTDLISYRLMGVPFARDIYNAVLQGTKKKGPVTGARMPATEAFKMAQDLSYRAGSAFDSGSEKSVKALAWSAAELSSLWSGIPATRIYKRWVKGTRQIEEGDGWWGNHFIPQENKKQ